MKLFRVRRKPKSGEEDKQLVLDTDAEAQPPAVTPAPDAAAEAEADVQAEAQAVTPTPDAAAEAAAPTEEEAPVPEGDLLARISAETDSESEAEGDSAEEEDPLDADLVDIFREAKNEVQESTLASELEDIPAQELLSDLMGVSRRLGTMPKARAESDRGRK